MNRRERNKGLFILNLVGLILIFASIWGVLLFGNVAEKDYLEGLECNENLHTNRYLGASLNTKNIIMMIRHKGYDDEYHGGDEYDLYNPIADISLLYGTESLKVEGRILEPKRELPIRNKSPLTGSCAWRIRFLLYTLLFLLVFKKEISKNKKYNLSPFLLIILLTYMYYYIPQFFRPYIKLKWNFYILVVDTVLITVFLIAHIRKYKKISGDNVDEEDDGKTIKKYRIIKNTAVVAMAFLFVLLLIVFKYQYHFYVRTKAEKYQRNYECIAICTGISIYWSEYNISDINNMTEDDKMRLMEGLKKYTDYSGIYGSIALIQRYGDKKYTIDDVDRIMDLAYESIVNQEVNDEFKEFYSSYRKAFFNMIDNMDYLHGNFLWGFEDSHTYYRYLNSYGFRNPYGFILRFMCDYSYDGYKYFNDHDHVKNEYKDEVREKYKKRENVDYLDDVKSKEEALAAYKELEKRIDDYTVIYLRMMRTFEPHHSWDLEYCLAEYFVYR